MKRIATIFAVLLLLAVVGWQQYQIHKIKLQVAKLDRTAGDTIQMLSMQNMLNELLGSPIHGVEYMNKLMSDRLNKFDYYPSREERETKR
jgi:hypothetical protein